MKDDAEAEIEIPAIIKMTIPWRSVIATLPTADIMQQLFSDSSDNAVLIDQTGADAYMEEEEDLDIDYEQDISVLKVVGKALMPGRFTGMNGLTAEYDHEVIRQDGLDITGRPVGEMHEKGNSGYVKGADIDEITAHLSIDTEIYDADAIKKVKQGVYTGFSIDTKVWGYQENGVFLVKKIGFKKGRVDLVDRPACNDCLFQDVEDVNNAAQQTLIQNKDKMEMTSDITISKEEHESLLKIKADAEQAKIEQAAKDEVMKVQLIKEIKVVDPNFDADQYLQVATSIKQKLGMLEALSTQLKAISVDEAPEDINPPKSGVTVTQGLETPTEIEVSTVDAEKFIENQFIEYFMCDLSLASMHEDFDESLKAVMAEEARELVNVV